MCALVGRQILFNRGEVVEIPSRKAGDIDIHWRSLAFSRGLTGPRGLKGEERGERWKVKGPNLHPPILLILALQRHSTQRHNFTGWRKKPPFFGTLALFLTGCSIKKKSRIIFFFFFLWKFFFRPKKWSSDHMMELARIRNGAVDHWSSSSSSIGFFWEKKVATKAQQAS